MIRHATPGDIPAVASLLNDPAIRPTVGKGMGYLDPAALISDPRNVCLFSDDGGAMFAWRGPGIFEGHSFFRARGREAISLGRAILARLFLEQGARMVWGATPEGLKAARWFNRKVGFKSLGMIDTPEGRCELFVQER